MSVSKKMQLRIGIGFAAEVLTMFIMLLLSALLISSGRLSEDFSVSAVCISGFIAAAVGGFICASGEGKRLPRSMAATVLFYVTLWTVAVFSGKRIVFQMDNITQTVCIFIGAVLGAVLSPYQTKKKKRHFAPSRRKVEKHMVT